MNHDSQPPAGFGAARPRLQSDPEPAAAAPRRIRLPDSGRVLPESVISVVFVLVAFLGLLAAMLGRYIASNPDAFVRRLAAFFS